MKPDPITVPPGISVQEFVDDYVFHHYYKFYPVINDSRPISCISVDKVKSIPKDKWRETTVGQLAETCSEDNSISANTDAVEALSRINRTGRSRLLVVDDNKLEGVISTKDMVQFLSLKVDLEEEQSS
jgi:predicted transcriptional regulator